MDSPVVSSYAFDTTKRKGTDMNEKQVNELLYQAIETEIGGQQIYKTAINCAQNDDLREEWGKYLEETEEHERILRDVFEKLSLDPRTETPGRKVVRHQGESLVVAMEMAKRSDDGVGAQLVAAECVVLAETKDHANWELIGGVAKKLAGAKKAALQEAYEQVEEQEDEHLYHTMGWARELWLQSLGLPAVLPPPEEKKKVATAIGAERAKNARSSMLRGNGPKRVASGNGRKRVVSKSKR
jgi:rubrerythrin